MSIRDGQTKIDREQDWGDRGGRGAQTIEGRATPTRKALVAGLTLEPLDALGAALAVAHEGMESGIGVAAIVALWVGASVSGGTDGFGRAAAALALAPREDARLADMAPQWVRLGAEIGARTG